MVPVVDDAPVVRSLDGLREAENACRRCPLYRDATQAVPGEGPRRARVMLVGEQPGDKETLPASRSSGRPEARIAVLDRALADAGIPRDETFVTNAVKHFKFEPRGKRRLHKKPNAYEIERCKWWLDQERAIVQPEVIVALGATAARSLLGRVGDHQRSCAPRRCVLPTARGSSSPSTRPRCCARRTRPTSAPPMRRS